MSIIDDGITASIAKFLKSCYVLAPNGHVPKGVLYTDYVPWTREDHDRQWAKALKEFDGDEDEASIWTGDYTGSVSHLTFFRHLPMAMAMAFPRAVIGRPRAGKGFGPWAYKGIEPLFPEVRAEPDSLVAGEDLKLGDLVHVKNGMVWRSPLTSS